LNCNSMALMINYYGIFLTEVKKRVDIVERR